MDRGELADPFGGLKEAKGEYKVYDSHYEKIGKVDDILVDEDDRVMYVGLKMGLFGTNSTIVPVELVRVNDKRQLIEVMETEEAIKNAPHFGKSEELTPEFEDRVRNYFGLQPLYGASGADAGRQTRGDSYVSDDRYAPDPRVDTEPGERAAEQGGASQRGAFDREPVRDRSERRDSSSGLGRDEDLVYDPDRASGAEVRGSEDRYGSEPVDLDIPLDAPPIGARDEPAQEPVRGEAGSGRNDDTSGATVHRKPASGWDSLEEAGRVTVHRKRR
jgi:hypothetical protein